MRYQALFESQHDFRFLCNTFIPVADMHRNIGLRIFEKAITWVIRFLRTSFRKKFSRRAKKAPPNIQQPTTSSTNRKCLWYNIEILFDKISIRCINFSHKHIVSKIDFCKWLISHNIHSTYYMLLIMVTYST